VEIMHGLKLEVHYQGNPIVYYDGNFNRFNGAPYICDEPGNFRFQIEFLLDKTSVEAYIGNGKLFISEQLKKEKPEAGLSIKGQIKVHAIELFELSSIWKTK
jgi:hypothetical protein